jgi:hypothetical protein
MNQTTLSKMKLMALHGMHNEFKTAIETGRTDHYTLDQFIAQLEKDLERVRFDLAHLIDYTINYYSNLLDKLKGSGRFLSTLNSLLFRS